LSCGRSRCVKPQPGGLPGSGGVGGPAKSPVTVQLPSFAVTRPGPSRPPAFACTRAVDGKFSGLTPKRELETIGEERLQHDAGLILAGITFSLCLDVVALGVGPRRTSGDPKGLKMPADLDQVLQCEVRHNESAARQEVVAAARLVGGCRLDRRYLECRTRRGQLRANIWRIEEPDQYRQSFSDMEPGHA
jgi:hypothetical protein